MLSQSSRLPYREFRLRGYRTIPTPFFVLKIKKGAGVENRLGVVISAAVEKKATRRNFWKRQTKSMFALLPPMGIDFLIIFSGGVKQCTIKKFKEEFLRVAHTAH